MFGKKAQGMHTASGLDLVIILIGVIIGVAVVYYGLHGGWLPSGTFCPAPVEALI
ncbi:MAG: hypothetical protein HY438_00485 [DPANN group archaeon]|nr:hypothetical protein [DPANN group archaeon]